jgi:uncharacterized cupin superfamily protein
MSGWFVRNLGEAQWFANEHFGTSALYLEPDQAPTLGINVGVLQPGRPACRYHAENQAEAFLVLHGEALLVVEGEERPLRTWDFFWCPPWTKHVLVGAGDGPCAIIFIGHRAEVEELLYPQDDAAARHGASVDQDTSDPDVAYAGLRGYAPVGVPPGLPWS